MGLVNSTKKRKNKVSNNLLINHNNLVSSKESCSPKIDSSLEQCSKSMNPCENRKYLNGESIKNIFPTDKDELKRLELTHAWSKLLWNGPLPLPVGEVFNRNAKVLDIGCGNVIWCLDMAQKYPNCHFTEFDVYSPPDIDIKESNIEFTLGNILDGLPYEDNTFDLVFMRSMKGLFTREDYNSCLREIIRVSRRWMLIFDSDIVLIDGGPLAVRLRDQVLDELLTNFGTNMMPSSTIRKCLEDNKDLSDISFEDEQCPVGEWGGEIGTIYWQVLKWATKNLYHSVSSLGYSEGEYNLMVDEAFDELNQYKAYNMIFRICAKKKERDLR